MKIHEDRSHMNIDTRWFEKGYAKEDVHSLRLQSLCTEAEATANKQFYDSHTREEWEQYIRQASLESSAAMKPVMETIAQDFVCYQYDENIPVSYGSDRWDLYFWCNHFSGTEGASERDFSYFTLTFNERQTLEKRKKVCQQVLDLLCSRFQEHPNLNVAVQYSIWFDHPKIHAAVERAKPRLHGLHCIQDQKEGKLLLQDGVLLFKPKYAKKYACTLSQSQILSLSWELGVEDKEPDTAAAPVTLPYKKFGATHPHPAAGDFLPEWKPCHTNDDMGKRRPGTLGDSHRQPARPAAKRPCLYRHQCRSGISHLAHPTWSGYTHRPHHAERVLHLSRISFSCQPAAGTGSGRVCRLPEKL